MVTSNYILQNIFICTKPFCLLLGVVNVLVTTPLWVVNTRLKLQGARFRNEDIQPTHYNGIMGNFKRHHTWSLIQMCVQ